jgi:hypothetical protein
MKWKFLNLVALTAITASLLAMSNCKDEEKTFDDQTVEVNNLEGTVYFNEDSEAWYIAVHKEGTYDEVQLFFPSHLDDAYKIPNEKVVFSGVVSNLTTNVTLPAGVQCFKIEITFITRASTDLFEPSMVAFDSLDVQTVQQLVQGKWKIYRQCGGVVGCQGVKEVFTHEYVGTDKLRISRIDKTDEKAITEWRKSSAGYEIIVSSTDSEPTYAFTLTMLVNKDTLYFGTTHFDEMPVFTWAAEKVKQ